MACSVFFTDSTPHLVTWAASAKSTADHRLGDHWINQVRQTIARTQQITDLASGEQFGDLGQSIPQRNAAVRLAPVPKTPADLPGGGTQLRGHRSIRVHPPATHAPLRCPARFDRQNSSAMAASFRAQAGGLRHAPNPASGVRPTPHHLRRRQHRQSQATIHRTYVALHGFSWVRLCWSAPNFGVERDVGVSRVK